LATNNKYLAAIDKTAVVEFPRDASLQRIDPLIISDQLRAFAQWLVRLARECSDRELPHALEELAVDPAAKAMELNRWFDVVSP